MFIFLVKLVPDVWVINLIAYIYLVWCINITLIHIHHYTPSTKLYGIQVHNVSPAVM